MSDHLSAVQPERMVLRAVYVPNELEERSRLRAFNGHVTNADYKASMVEFALDSGLEPLFDAVRPPTATPGNPGTVLRSVYLRPGVDARVKALAHERRRSVYDTILALIAAAFERNPTKEELERKARMTAVRDRRASLVESAYISLAVDRIVTGLTDAAETPKETFIGTVLGEALCKPHGSAVRTGETSHRSMVLRDVSLSVPLAERLREMAASSGVSTAVLIGGLLTEAVGGEPEPKRPRKTAVTPRETSPSTILSHWISNDVRGDLDNHAFWKGMNISEFKTALLQEALDSDIVIERVDDEARELRMADHNSVLRSVIVPVESARRLRAMADEANLPVTYFATDLLAAAMAKLPKPTSFKVGSGKGR